MNPQEQIESTIFRSELELRIWGYRLLDPHISAIERFEREVRTRTSKLISVQASAAMEDFVPLLPHEYLCCSWRDAPSYFAVEVLDKYREENFLVHTKKQQPKADTLDQTVADVLALQPLSEEEYAALPGLSEEQIQAALERGRREANIFSDKYGTPAVPFPGRRYW